MQDKYFYANILKTKSRNNYQVLIAINIILLKKKQGESFHLKYRYQHNK